jgi:hypothetical protein
VRNIEGRNGRAVPNQFVIDDGDVEYFQSYKSIICKKEYGQRPAKITLDAATWDYSKTTGRYRNQFLGETKTETERKIKSGEYTLANLNV